MNPEQTSGLVLLGVGGGGCRLAAAVRNAYGADLCALGVDTDALASRAISDGGMTCLLLGGSRLAGHGTGGDAILGREAAQEDLDNIRKHLEGARTVVITACLGGGAGGGATPEILKALRDMGRGIVTICFVTRPFGFEGDARCKAAERTLPLIEEHADSMVVVPLDDLFIDAGKDLLAESIQAAEEILAAGITLLWRLITKPGFIRLDADRLHAMIFRGGNARFGFGTAAGSGRSDRVVTALKNCRLLRSGDALAKANAVMLGILAGHDLRMAEVGEIMAKLQSLCKKDCIIEMGVILDDQYDGRIDLVALAFESWSAGIPIDPAKESSASAQQEPPVADAALVQAGNRKSRSKGSKLSFGAKGRGKFQNVEPTMFNGQDLDLPTYVRRGITLER